MLLHPSCAQRSEGLEATNKNHFLSCERAQHYIDTVNLGGQIMQSGRVWYCNTIGLLMLKLIKVRYDMAGSFFSLTLSVLLDED